MTRKWMRALALAAAVLPAAAVAEVVTITGEFPAPNREASFLRSIAVGRVSGQDGPALANAIERALLRPGGDGRVFFDVVGGRTGRANAEGMLNGSITTGVQENPFKKKEKKCAEKDGNGKCVREEEVETNCRRRIINVNVDLQLTRTGDGRILYSEEKPFRDEVSWCQGASPPRTTEETIASAIRDIANSVPGQIAPRIETYRVRVRESTKNLPRDVAKEFKNVVKLSQRDLRAACSAWEAMNAANPGHPSIVFDLGLCAEQRGDYDRAVTLYQEAYRLIGGDGDEARVGLDRANQLIAGREDARERARRN